MGIVGAALTAREPATQLFAHRTRAPARAVEASTLREAGRRMSVSESRVSQIHTRLRSRLYEQLASEPALFTSVG